jgi:iron complex transport system substrate-binding protein
MKRLRQIALAVSLGALALTGCSTGATDSADAAGTTTTKAESGAFPATVTDAFGTTTIEKEPKRVVTLGWSDQDIALALGVAPVGAVKITWGGNADGSTPWYDAKLKEEGAAAPTRYDDADGVPFDDIAKLDPDLILATNSGLTKADYTKLSKLAPTVAYPKVPWGTSWQDSTKLVGQALGREDAADDLVRKVEDEVKETAAKYPALKDKTFIFATFDPKDTSTIGYYTPLDNRPQMLEDLGMKNAPVIEKLTKGSSEFWKTISAERASTLQSDVVVFYGETGKDEARIASNKLFGQIPAVKSGARLSLVDKTDALTMSAPSPLALPWFLDKIVPQLAAAGEKAQS